MIEEISISSLEAWRRLRHLRGVQFLDSAKFDPEHGRWSILMADPAEVIFGTGRAIQWRNSDGLLQFDSDPWEAVEYFLSRFFPAVPCRARDPVEAAGSGLVAGYLGYELGHALERLPAPRKPVLDHPGFWLAYYDTAAVFDHAEGRAYLVSSGRSGRGGANLQRARFRIDQFLDELDGGVIPFAQPNARPPKWTPLLSQEQYATRFDAIQSYIRRGDIYQANLTYPFLASDIPAPASIYERLRVLNPAPFAAYLDAGTFQVLSSSPEEFLKTVGREARTRPIKGTCPRFGDGPSDWERAQGLLQSAKNRAELLMITDLLRNDLGRIAEFGSVCVPELVKCEEFATVYHLVSTITAHLKPGVEPLDVLMACFPGGSITGAPKLRSQEIIHELEPYSRGVYTGSIGWVGAGMSHWNVAIRTMICARGQASFSVGGAITSDSSCDAEHLETLDKARAMLRVFDETGLPVNESLQNKIAVSSFPV
jgi:para-aminobenzoate synthetase component 1